MTYLLYLFTILSCVCEKYMRNMPSFVSELSDLIRNYFDNTSYSLSHWFHKIMVCECNFYSLFTDEDIWDHTQSTSLFRIIRPNLDPY